MAKTFCLDSVICHSKCIESVTINLLSIQFLVLQAGSIFSIYRLLVFMQQKVSSTGQEMKQWICKILMLKQPHFSEWHVRGANIRHIFPYFSMYRNYVLSRIFSNMFLTFSLILKGIFYSAFFSPTWKKCQPDLILFIQALEYHSLWGIRNIYKQITANT